MVDLDLVPVIEKIIDSCPKIQTVIILTDRKNIPETSLKNILCYEDLLREQSSHFEWVSGIIFVCALIKNEGRSNKFQI